MKVRPPGISNITPQVQERSPTEGLVICPGALGDTVLRALAIRRLMRGGVLPSTVLIVGTREYLPVFRAFLPRAAVQPFDRREWSHLFSKSKAPWPDLCAATHRVRIAVVWLPTDRAAEATLRLCGIPDVRWADPRQMKPGEHQLAALLHSVGEPHFEPLEYGWSRAWSRERHVVIHPGAGSPRKRYSVAFFVRVSERLQEVGWDVTWLLGPAEMDANDLQRASESFHTIRCPDLPDLMTLLQKSGFVLGNDTGVMHLAAVLGIPVIAVFAATDPETWHPVGPEVITIDMRKGRPKVRQFDGLHEKEPEASTPDQSAHPLQIVLEFLTELGD